MPEVRFYHLEHTSLDQALPALLAKALEKGHRILVKTENDAEAERLNTHLWAYHPNSFIPHGTAKDGHTADQPVFLTAGNDNPNNSDILILTHDTENVDTETYTMICDMFDGRKEEQLSAARNRWKKYKDAGYDVTYWQQSANGGWSKKA